MDTQIFLIVAGIFLVFILLALIIWRRGSRKRSVAQQDEAEIHARMAGITDATLETGERQASMISEQIEEMVKMDLAQYPDLSDVSIDFGTGEDGGLEIWIDGERYSEVSTIPDDRIRRSIEKAVNSFND
jgi:hypothetical protein